jgi:hypothetical protein
VSVHYRIVEGEAVPVTWWKDGSPLRFVPQWQGRGLHLELGTRAYRALMADT